MVRSSSRTTYKLAQSASEPLFAAMHGGVRDRLVVDADDGLKELQRRTATDQRGLKFPRVMAHPRSMRQQYQPPNPKEFARQQRKEVSSISDASGHGILPQVQIE